MVKRNNNNRKTRKNKRGGAVYTAAEVDTMAGMLSDLFDKLRRLEGNYQTAMSNIKANYLTKPLEKIVDQDTPSIQSKEYEERQLGMSYDRVKTGLASELDKFISVANAMKADLE